MLAPGMTISGDKVLATIAPDIVPDFFNNGVGFMNNGSVAIDDAVPAGDFYFAGYRRNGSGAFYGVDFLIDNFVGNYNQGIPLSVSGQIIYNLLSTHDVYVNGNPVRNNSNAGLCLVL
jgi:hypothetical protein